MPSSRAVIGLISDTHGRVRPQLAHVFAGVDCIVHAGDVGDAAVLRALAAIAPVEAVSGNVDDRHDRRCRVPARCQ
jgi:predicted phosphodiesterase